MAGHETMQLFPNEQEGRHQARHKFASMASPRLSSNTAGRKIPCPIEDYLSLGVYLSFARQPYRACPFPQSDVLIACRGGLRQSKLLLQPNRASYFCTAS